MVVTTPSEDGGFDGEVRDDGGKVRGRAVLKSRGKAKVTADLDGDSIEGLT